MPTNYSRSLTHAHDCTCASCEDFFGADDEPTTTIRQAIAETLPEFTDSTRYRFGAGNGRPTPAAARTNRYAGRCIACGSEVAAGTGTLVRDGQGWAVRHAAGACVVVDYTDAGETVTTVAAAARPNRYAGACGHCGQRVAAEAGTIVKVDGRWVTFHVGDCPERVEVAEPTTTVPAGHYAIASTTAGQDLTFVRIDRPTTGTYAGRVFAKYVIGGQPDQRIAAAAVAGILARIEAAGVEQAARLYGTEIGRCCRCNRHLTDQASREAGIGPECRNRVGF